MSMIEVRLLELAIKGDRLDEINAEEALAAQVKWQEHWQRLRSWLRRPGSRPTSAHRTAHKPSTPLKPVV